MSHNISVKSRMLPVIVLMVVCTAIFFNAFANDFLWDDVHLIQNNRYIREYKNIPLFFTPRYWNELGPFPGQYRPLRTVSFAVDYHFWQLNPVGYHFTNLLLHIINVLFIYVLMLRISDADRNKNREDHVTRYFWGGMPFLTALFFAAHPIHTESILLIKNRSDLLSFLFFLISLLFFVKSITVRSGALDRLLIISSWLCFIPAILSKEMALTLPGVLILYTVCFLVGRKRRKALIRIIPYGVILIVYFWFMQSFIKLDEPALTGFSTPSGSGQQALTVIKTIGFYSMLLIAPVRLNSDHTFSLPESVMEPAVLLSLTTLLLISLWIFQARQRSQVPAFGLGWILLTLLPAANIVYLVARPIAEQRLYIPSFGFCLILAYGIKRLSYFGTKRLRPKRMTTIIAVLITVIISLYASITVSRNADWRDALTLFSKTVASNPSSARAHYNLALTLSKIGHYENAVEHYLTALHLDPYDALIYSDLGLALFHLKRYEEAVYYYNTALRLLPNNALIYNHLGVALSSLNKYQEAINNFKIALCLQPDFAKAHNDLGMALSKTGKKQKAIYHFQKSLAFKPDYTEAHNNLGVELTREGRLEEAISHYKIALQLEPTHAVVHNNLGLALTATGRSGEAASHFRAAISKNPNYAEAHINLGVMLAAKKRWQEAISHYKIALDLDPNNATVNNNLGVAMFETGHIRESAGYYRTALNIMPDNAEANYNLGVISVILGDYQEAASFFARSLQTRPDHIKIQQAYKECLKRIEQSPDD